MAAHRRASHRRACRARRSIRDEYARRDPPGMGGLSLRPTRRRRVARPGVGGGRFVPFASARRLALRGERTFVDRAEDRDLEDEEALARERTPIDVGELEPVDRTAALGRRAEADDLEPRPEESLRYGEEQSRAV